MNEEIKKFIIEAKRKTYADPDSKPNILPDSRKQFLIKNGQYKYLDTYAGSNPFSGEEIIYYQDKPIWIMNYYGLVLDPNTSSEDVYAFLKKCLSNIPNDFPIRGPQIFEDGNFRYELKITGDLRYFYGKEDIYLNNRKIYELNLHGGVLI